ncbi:hypothetical protein VYU27_004359 [Nannochloropsis oceanica]
MQRSNSAGSSGSARLPHPPLCRLWALYRKSLRLFLIGELTKPELDAVVIYTLGDENVQVHNALVRGLVHNVMASSLPSHPEGIAATTMSRVRGLGFEGDANDGVLLKGRMEGEGSAGSPNNSSSSGSGSGQKRIRLKEQTKEEEDGDKDEDEDEETERAQTLHAIFQREFGEGSAVWDVWAPMQQANHRRAAAEAAAQLAELEFRQVKSLMDFRMVNGLPSFSSIPPPPSPPTSCPSSASASQRPTTAYSGSVGSSSSSSSPASSFTSPSRCAQPVIMSAPAVAVAAAAAAAAITTRSASEETEEGLGKEGGKEESGARAGSSPPPSGAAAVELARKKKGMENRKGGGRGGKDVVDSAGILSRASAASELEPRAAVAATAGAGTHISAPILAVGAAPTTPAAITAPSTLTSPTAPEAQPASKGTYGIGPEGGQSEPQEDDGNVVPALPALPPLPPLAASAFSLGAAAAGGINPPDENQKESEKEEEESEKALVSASATGAVVAPSAPAPTAPAEPAAPATSASSSSQPRAPPVAVVAAAADEAPKKEGYGTHAIDVVILTPSSSPPIISAAATSPSSERPASPSSTFKSAAPTGRLSPPPPPPPPSSAPSLQQQQQQQEQQHQWQPMPTLKHEDKCEEPPVVTEASYLPEACMPHPLIIHFLLRTAGATDSELGSRLAHSAVAAAAGRGGGGERASPSPTKRARKNHAYTRHLAVSVEAMEGLDEGAELFVKRLLARCVHVSKRQQEGGSTVVIPPFPMPRLGTEGGIGAKVGAVGAAEAAAVPVRGEALGQIESSQSGAAILEIQMVRTDEEDVPNTTTAVAAGQDGCSNRKEDGDAGAGSRAEETAKKKNGGAVMIDAAMLFKALRVPSTDDRDPLGRLFPPDGLLEELVASSGI